MATSGAASITLYDIPTRDASSGPWSPSTFKARLALQVKGIPFKTEWIEYPDIEALCKRIGAPPTSKTGDGRDRYTLPVIHDHSTGRVIAESFAIALYLDEIYPNAVGSALIPEGMQVLQLIFAKWFTSVAAMKAYPALIHPMYNLIPPRSAAHLRETREQAFGVPLEEIAPYGSEKREECWKMTEAGFGEMNEALGGTGSGRIFILGSEPSFADVVIASTVLWIKASGQPEDWERVKGWHGGRWVTLIEELQEVITKHE